MHLVAFLLLYACNLDFCRSFLHFDLRRRTSTHSIADGASFIADGASFIADGASFIAEGEDRFIQLEMVRFIQLEMVRFIQLERGTLNLLGMRGSAGDMLAGAQSVWSVWFVYHTSHHRAYKQKWSRFSKFSWRGLGAVVIWKGRLLRLDYNSDGEARKTAQCLS